MLKPSEENQTHIGLDCITTGLQLNKAQAVMNRTPLLIIVQTWNNTDQCGTSKKILQNKQEKKQETNFLTVPSGGEIASPCWWRWWLVLKERWRRWRICGALPPRIMEAGWWREGRGPGDGGSGFAREGMAGLDREKEDRGCTTADGRRISRRSWEAGKRRLDSFPT
jgi:hypothetical protein